MFSLFLRVISPFVLFLVIMVLYSYITGQDGRQMLDSLIDLISMVVSYIADVFNRL